MRGPRIYVPVTEETRAAVEAMAADQDRSLGKMASLLLLAGIRVELDKVESLEHNEHKAVARDS